MYTLGRWHNSHTDISKYLVQKLVQLVDPNEIITNRAPTTNGLILAEELVQVADMSLKRWKNHRRLISLINESVDNKIPTSIANDIVISKHFKSFILTLEKLGDNINLEAAKYIHRESYISSSIIRKNYFQLIKEELSKVDVNSTQFKRNADIIDKTLPTLVSQWIYDGHSSGFILLAASRLRKWNTRGIIDGIFKISSLDNDREYRIFISGPIHEDIRNILNTEQTSLLTTNLKDKTITPNASRNSRDGLPIYDGYEFKAVGKDPHSAFLTAVSNLQRRIFLRKPKFGMDNFSVLWENPFYLNRYKYASLNYKIGRYPITPSTRTNTLEESLYKINNPISELTDEILTLLEEPLYFYNLAQNAPTVENSYALLWTCLESLMGLRTDVSDIQTVQDNVSEALALGAIGRRISSFVMRLISCKEIDINSLALPTHNTYSLNDLGAWGAWIADQTVRDTARDPYNELQKNSLLCNQYCKLNDKWKNHNGILDDINHSKTKIVYQLDRLYLTRNQIIHSAKFRNTSMHLWSHLEWIVGKLLAQSLIITSQHTYINTDSRDIIFSIIRNQYTETIDFISRNSGKSITADTMNESGLSRFPVLCF